MLAPIPLDVQTHISPAVHSVPAQTPMKTGQKSRILLSVGGSRTGSLNATTVSNRSPKPQGHRAYANRQSGKKIKRRLEDLEKRASSSSPEHVHAELSPSRSAHPTSKRRSSKTGATSQLNPNSQDSTMPAYSFAPGTKSELSPEQFPRDLSVSPPPVLPQSYSLPDPNIHAGYYQEPHIQTLPASYSDYTAPPGYLPSPPITLPSMTNTVPYQSLKSSSYYDNGDMMPQHYVNGYTPFTSMELPMQQSYSDSTAHVNHPEYILHFY